MNKLKVIPCVLLACVLAIGCQQKLTSENLAKVTNDMSPAQVEEILGKPTKVETTQVPLLSTTRFVYEHNEDEVTLVFVNDKLVSKTGTFGADK